MITNQEPYFCFGHCSPISSWNQAATVSAKLRSSNFCMMNFGWRRLGGSLDMGLFKYVIIYLNDLTYPQMISESGCKIRKIHCSKLTYVSGACSWIEEILSVEKGDWKEWLHHSRWESLSSQPRRGTWDKSHQFCGSAHDNHRKTTCIGESWEDLRLGTLFFTQYD
jgi:hypothetical protein